MRILIGTIEICGWIKILAEELEKLGHTVITISEPNRNYPDYKYDISPESFARDYILLRTKKSKFLRVTFLFLYSINKKIFGQRINNYIKNKSNNYFFTNTDLFIYFWNGLSTDESDIAEFKKRGVKIITWFVGDDVRYYPEMQKQFGIISKFFEGYFKKSFDALVKKIRIHEKYADVIYSVPDQATLALRPYHHLQIPVQLNRFKFSITGNKVPVVVHIPSNPQIKGTEIIRKTIESLKKDGLDFVYKELINITNTEVLKELSDADILVDELFLHGPGVLSFEAMASGCAVATRFITDSPKVFSPPVVAIDEINIKEKIRQLITDEKLRFDMIIKGREYIVNNNTAHYVVANMMAAIYKEMKPDYFPSYFRDSYEPNIEQVNKLNEYTNIVKDELWYKANVKSGERLGLKF